MRLQVPLELVRRGEGPAAAAQGTLEGPLTLAAAVRQQVHLQLVLLGEGLSALRLGAQVQHHAWGRAQRPARALGGGPALSLLLRRRGRRRFRRLGQKELGRQLWAVTQLRGVREPGWWRGDWTPRLRERRDPGLPGRQRGRGQGEDAVLKTQQQVLVMDSDGACEGRPVARAWGWSRDRDRDRDGHGDRARARARGHGQAAGAQRRAARGVRAALVPLGPQARLGLLPPHGPFSLIGARGLHVATHRVKQHQEEVVAAAARVIRPGRQRARAWARAPAP